MAANSNPTLRKRRLGAELRRLRQASGLTSTEAAKRLLVSQPKISHMENGRRAIHPRDVRDLCAIYGLTDQQVIDSLMRMAKESGRQDWCNVYGDIPHSLYVSLVSGAATVHAYQLVMIPDLLQTPAYAQAVIEETIPLLTAEQAAARLKVRLRKQHRIYDPAGPLRLSVIVDESALRRVVGSPDIMREQLEHLSTLGAEPHITVQVLPFTVGAHPGFAGRFCILRFADSPEAVVHVERGGSSDLYLDKPSDVQHYSAMYDHLQAQALSPDNSCDFITDVTEVYVDAASRP
ncbi:helix-turn-helix domain-containing protein [Streptomyces sp. NPDC090032]|uniref:helix-turn-helix domain-containing protein n=1 Tax=unclassified Streptomyces TaxID=2593676 RepID=UPI003724769B